jgi:hypothetical protein
LASCSPEKENDFEGRKRDEKESNSCVGSLELVYGVYLSNRFDIYKILDAVRLAAFGTICHR